MDSPRHAAHVTDLETFLALSRCLTGVEALDRGLALEYLERLRSETPALELDQILTSFRCLEGDPDRIGRVEREIVGSATLAPLAQRITLLWYTSAFEQGGNWRFGTPRQYFGALLWPTIGAHPPALSGGYFGYWKYPPEN